MTRERGDVRHGVCVNLAIDMKFVTHIHIFIIRDSCIDCTHMRESMTGTWYLYKSGDSHEVRGLYTHIHSV